MSGPGAWMRAEIDEQPAMLQRIAADPDSACTAGELLRAQRPRSVIFAGRGTSDHAAAFGKYLAETMLGLPCGLASMSALSVLDSPVTFDGVAWIAVSQSGESPDLITSTARAGEAGALTIVITNEPGSALARIADHVVPLRAGPERSVAATKTFTAELLALRLMIGEAAEAARPDPGRIHDCASEVLAADGGNRLNALIGHAPHVLFTGRGLTWPVASEGALKLIEASGTTALAYSSADLLHGPIALVRPGDPVIACLPDSALGVSVGPTLARLAERGAHLATIGSAPEAGIVVPTSGDPAVDAILQVLPLQDLCLQHALAMGRDPDAPGGLSKVTLTR